MRGLQQRPRATDCFRRPILGRRDRAFVLALASVCLACTTPTSAPTSEGLASVTGTVRLVPRAGVEPSSGDGAYGDRSLRDVEFVDYTRPGFSVVYSDGAPPADRAAIAIRASTSRLRMEPAENIAGPAGAILVHNDTDAPRIVSDPVEGLIREIAAGQTLRIEKPKPGLHTLHVVGEADLAARVFVAPGPFARVSARGRYVLRGLAPGPHSLHAWHGRFAPVTHHLELLPNERRELDIAIGVDVVSEVDHRED